MTEAVTVCGWLVAALAALAVVSERRRLAGRREAAARACHEVRGPLTCMRLGLELVARERRLSVARLRAIELGLSQAALALDDLQGCAGDRARERVDVAGLLVDTVEAHRVSSGAAERLRGCAAESPVQVWGDRLRLAQATANLIGNAIEHGDGVVEVSATAEGSWVRIEIADGGPGLPAPVAELVRRAGARSRWHRLRRQRGGTRRGRGLAIAAAIAEAHGGSLVAAPSRRGARLVLRLPGA